MNKFKALYRVFWIDNLDNKFALMANIVLPIAFYLFDNTALMFHPVSFSVNQLVTTRSLGPFWGYIVVTTLLNLVILPTLTDRESGFYKEYSFIVGSKWKILITNFLVQDTVLFLEILLFNSVVMLSLHFWSPAFLLAGLAAVLFFALPVTLVCCLFLIFRVRLQSLTIIETLLITAMMALAVQPVHQFWLESLMTLNPCYYVSKGAIFFFNSFSGRLDLVSLLQLLVVTLIYSLVGAFSLARFDVKPILRRA